MYLANHFREEIKLEDLARQSGLSKFHFHRLFVKANKCTPQAYLEKLRMDHASHYMILFSQSSMAEVAFESGYSSPSCFSRAFKKHYSISPTQYREQNKLENAPKRIPQAVPFRVQYLHRKIIGVQKVKLDPERLTSAYQQIARENPNCKEAVGFYLDTPVHVSQKECRHYIGFNQPVENKAVQTLEILSGFYTSIPLKGAFQDLKDSLFDLHDQTVSSGYAIDSLIGFEKILLPQDIDQFDYLKTHRELFVKVRHR